MSMADGPARRWPAHAGECAALVRDFPWNRTPLGPPDGWPQSLRTCIDLMLPSAAQMLLFWGPEFIAFYNDACAPAIGNKHPHALGRPARQSWSELWDDDLGPLLESVRSTGRTVAAENRPFRVDRSGVLEEVFFDISYSPVHDEAGGVGGVMCIVKETTARVQESRALAENRERIELALDAGAVIATWVYDVPNDRITGDERFARTFNIEPQAAGRGVPLAQAKQSIHPDDVAQVEARIAQAMARGGRYSAEYRVAQPDGSWRWIEAAGRVELAADGTPLRFPGVLIDISARKHVEAQREADLAELRRVQQSSGELLEQLRMAQAAGGIGVFVLDIGRNDLAVSAQFCRLFGLPVQPRYHTSEIERLIETGTSSTTETRADGSAELETVYRIRRPDDGRLRWLARRAEFVRDDAGHPVAMRGVVQDITTQKEAEAALRELNATLEQRVEERTRELQEAQARLHQSQKMEALGQLTGGIAHDFNNMLQGITGAIEVLRLRLKMGRTDDMDRYLSSAVQSTHRAAALVHRLLAYARRQSLATQAVDINTLVLSMEEMLRRTLGENIGLHVETQSDAWPALCDGNQLESAILNLAINARDAMPKGGLLTISTGNASIDALQAVAMEGIEPGDYATVCVLDTGSGMPPEVLAKVFDPFFTTKPIGQGTGLGLSMIYGFAKQSGGHVHLASEPGRGTAATLYLPRHREDQAPAQAGASAVAPQGDGETILVVEDDADVRVLVVEVLGELGYQVLEAVNGASALPHIEGPAKIDLMISDVGLPGMSGRQLAEIARRKRPGMPVLLVTGYTAAATERGEFLGPGMQMMTKPFSMEDLAHKVQELVGPA
jgi:PAS domain S-box-containing protein